MSEESRVTSRKTWVWLYKARGLSRGCCSTLMRRESSLIGKFRRLREWAFHLQFSLLDTLLLDILFLLIIMVMMMVWWRVRLAWSRLSTHNQPSRWVTSNLMSNTALPISFSLRRSASRVRILCRLLTYCLVPDRPGPSTAVTWNLGSSGDSSPSLSHRSSLSLDLIEALLSELLISMLHRLHNRVLISHHALSKHWGGSICVVLIGVRTSTQNELVVLLFRIDLSLVLSLGLMVQDSQMTALGMINSRGRRNTHYCRACARRSHTNLVPTWRGQGIAWSCSYS